MVSNRIALIGHAIVLAALISGCVTSSPVPRVIHDADELLVRLDPSKTCASGTEGAPFSHPIQLSSQQVRTLLGSLLAREKVGLLSSFVHASGTPRLFDDANLDQLIPPIQHAFAQASPEESVVFLLTTPAAEARSTVTSGALSIRGEVLSVALFNFRHAVRSTLSDVGATDRLSDVRETLRYVRQSPCVSVGEQDFALFFKEPTYQTQPRSGSLMRYPERALSIAYSSFLTHHLRATPQAANNESPSPRERQTLEDLTRRIAELEEANHALTGHLLDNSSPIAPVNPSKPTIDKRPDLNGETQRLLELIERLETRISDLERQRQAAPAH